MNDAEEFDELAKRQGHWGGGYQAKRQMAADKMQEPVREALKLADIAKIPTLTHGLLVKLADVEAVINEALAQPAQEPTSGDYALGYAEGFNDACKKPAQEPVAYVTGVYGGRFVVAPLNPAMILPTGMALYAGPA